jgi:hypothetical protein
MRLDRFDDGGRRRDRTLTPFRPRGNTTREIPSFNATAQAWTGPAPPNAMSVNSRGSMPCSTLWSRIARAIFSLTTS